MKIAMNAKQTGILGFTVLAVLFSGYAFAGSQPQETQVTRELEKGKLVFLCLSPNKTDSSFVSAKLELSGIERFFSGAASVFYMTNDDVKGKQWFGKLELADKETVVYTMTPSGDVVSKLRGQQITKANLLKPFMSSCCPTSSKGCKK